MANVDKVKVVVVGDSGVGKTSLCHLICKKEPLVRPSWTVGCTVDVMLHQYKEGTPEQKMYFVELWDVGGSASHRNARNVFYNSVNGIILVHDVTNRRSYENLNKWLSEVLNKDESYVGRRNSKYDSEQFAGCSQIPALVIGTKLDVVGESQYNIPYKNCKISDWGAEEITLDCQQIRSLAPGTGSLVKITRFFDKIISTRYYCNSNDRYKKSTILTSSYKYLHDD